MLDGDDADLSLDRLHRLPFVESDPDGLVVHDTIREAVAAALKATDPATHRRYRVAAWHVLRRELSEAGRNDLWRATADALYMLEQPLLRESFFPTGQRSHLLESACATTGRESRRSRAGTSRAKPRGWSRPGGRTRRQFPRRPRTRGKRRGVRLRLRPRRTAAPARSRRSRRRPDPRRPAARLAWVWAARARNPFDARCGHGRGTPPRHRPPAGSTSSASTWR
jgi:hypothetical protein